MKTKEEGSTPKRRYFKAGDYFERAELAQKKDKEEMEMELTERIVIIRKTMKQERNSRGMTVEQTSKMLGFSENYIGLVERGGRKPSLKLIYNFCEMFGKTPNELMLEAEEVEAFSIKEELKKKESKHILEVVELMEQLNEAQQIMLLSVIQSTINMGKAK